MLLTTCPNCGAKFKVAPEQLNVRQGRVMCGRCRHVFNAFEALKRIEDTDAGEVIDYSVVDSKPSTAPPAPPALPPDVGDTRPADTAIVADSADTPVPVEPAPEEVAPLSDLRESEAFDSYEDALRKLEQAEQVSPPVDELYVATSAAVSAAAADRDASLVSGTESMPRGEPIRSNEAPPEVPPQPSFEPAPAEAAAVAKNPLIGGALPRQSSPFSAWTWLATIAGAVLVLQAIYFFRSQIVQQYPQFRPSLAAACEFIGCSVSWGRDQASIKIESSDLIEPPGRPGKILLTATLANRAPTKQDYPVLEVKLTDANNAVLSSRVLQPLEYLGRTPAGDEGLAPNTELYINLNLELVGKSPASGYGLRAFYP